MIFNIRLYITNSMPRLTSIRTTKTVTTHCLLAYPIRIQPGSEPRCKQR